MANSVLFKLSDYLDSEIEFEVVDGKLFLDFFADTDTDYGPVQRRREVTPEELESLIDGLQRLLQEATQT